MPRLLSGAWALPLFLSLAVPAAAQPSDSGQTAPAPDFYVASNGQDANPGTASLPFATLQRAQQAVRDKIAAGLDKDLLVSIRGGVYPQTQALAFGPADSGTPEHAVTYAAAPGETVVLDGSRRIVGWHKGPGEIWTTQIPEVKAGRWYFRQLFVNGVRETRARTPNAGPHGTWWKIASSSASKDHPGGANEPVTLKVSGTVGAWANPSDIELVYMQNNESGRKRLGAIDPQAQTISLSTPNRWNPTAFSCDWPLSLPSAGKPCYLENALEFLDEPGEWYLDRRTGVLSYWPRPGEENPDRAVVVAPVVQNTMISVAGTVDRPVQNLHLRGMRVRYLDWPLPPWGYMALFCCNVATSGPPPGHRPIEAAVEFAQAKNCSFSDGAIDDAGGMGLCLRAGTSQIVIEGNDIGGLGAGGIALGWPNVAAGYLDAAPPPAPGEYAGYRIANNHIHDCGRDYFGAVGLLLMGMGHSVVSHNLIQDTAYAGIAMAGTQNPKIVFGGDNLLEFNDVSNAMQTTIDGAGIYITFPQQAGGTRLLGNAVHDTFGNPNHEHDGQPWGSHPPCAGIYLDGKCSNADFDENIVWHNPAAGPLIFDYPGAREMNRWRDNLFFKDSLPPAGLIDAVRHNAGLEAAYASRLTPQAGKPCDRYTFGNSAPGATWSAVQYDFPGEGRGIIQLVVRGNNAGQIIQLNPRGFSGTLPQLSACLSIETPQPTWGPEPMPMLGPVQAVNINTLLTTPPAAGQPLSLKPTAPPQVIWLAYHR